MGINDIDNEGTFVYASSGEPITFSDWTKGEPNNDANGEDCVGHWETNQDVEWWQFGQSKIGWNDRPCDFEAPVVCEGDEQETNNIFENIPSQLGPLETTNLIVSLNDHVFKIEGTVYSYSNEKSNFDSAKKHCAQCGGKLFEPQNKGTYEKVKAKLKTLGITDW